jgi:pilus assembly protein CpaC
MTQKLRNFKVLIKGCLLLSLSVGPVLADPYPQPATHSPAKEADNKAPSSTPEAKPTSPASSAPNVTPVAPSEAKNLVIESHPKGAAAQPVRDVGIANSKRIQLANHGTHVINLKQPAGQVLLTDPKVADVQLVTPSTLYVYGRSPGNTEIIVTGQDMQTAYRYQIHVVSDYRELEGLIRGFIPNSHIKVHSVPDGILLQGTVESAKVAEDIRALSQRYVGAQGTVVNQLKVKSSTQISLRVKIAEVKRTVVNQLGINWSTSPLQNLRFGLFTGRTASTTFAALPIGAPANFSPKTGTSSVGVNFPTNKFGGTDFSALLDALAQESLAKVLAEPNLVTRSGEEASFLVGGEYPYTVTQGVGAAVTTSIQFKPYGISLSFVPVVIGDMISLRVRPEVSDLDNTVTARDQAGNPIPSIKTRRAESTMEMSNGQSMIMAGLLSDKTSGTINNFPGLGDIPILGALFRSVEYQNDKTELVIIVTPYIVDPIDNPQDIVLPTDGLKFANLMDMILFNRINVGPGCKPCQGLSGNAGFYY